MPIESLTAGIDIGGTKISAVLCDGDGTVHARAVVPAPAREGGDAMASTAAGLVRRLEAEAGARVNSVGVGAAGVIDQTTGTVVAASDSFFGWAGYPLGAALERELGVPAVIDNDVNAFLAGELRWGAVQGARHVLGITLGTGVGGAIALDGRIFAGHRGAAGEIGHTPGYSEFVCTCGQVGHLETLASGRSIEARYAERMRATAVDGAGAAESPGAATIAELARAGDPDARAVFDAAGRAVALAVSSAATLFDLSVVVIGGGVRGAWDVLSPALERTLAEYPPVSGHPVTVHPAALGGDAVALGAAALAARDTAPLNHLEHSA